MISCNEDNVIPEIIGIELEDLVITELDQNEIENFPEINSFLSVSKGHTPITVFNVKSESMDMSGLIFEFPNNKTFATFHNKDTTLGNIDFSFWMTEYDNGKLSLQHKENSEDLALLYLNDNGDLNFDRISYNKSCFTDNLLDCGEYIGEEVGFLGGLVCGLFKPCVGAVVGACGITSGLSCLGVCNGDDDGCCWAWSSQCQ